MSVSQKKEEIKFGKIGRFLPDFPTLINRGYNNTMAQITRKDYLDGKVTHREYYGSIVEMAGIFLPENHYMVQKFKDSKDPHYNEHGLTIWDNMGILIGYSVFKSHGDSPTQAGFVCVKKEAVRQAIERLERKTV
jgi:hypothetical protein